MTDTAPSTDLNWTIADVIGTHVVEPTSGRTEPNAEGRLAFR